MKAVVVSRHGAPEVLELRDVPMPEPGPEDIVVSNSFVGVNFVDTQHRAGLYYPVTLPLIPGTEAAGIVSAVGEQVRDFQVGDRVAYAGYMGGDYAEYTRVPQQRLVAVPEGVGLDEAAAILLQGLTAYVLTHEVYAVHAGDTVLIHAAAGGVGSLLVQMVKQLGAAVIGTTSSANKAAIVREAGADSVIVTTQADFEEVVPRLTDQQGVHVIYDGVGGPSFEKNLSVLRARGHLVLFGLAGGRPAPLDVSRLSGITGTNNRGSLIITYPTANDYITTAEELRTYATALFDAMAQGHIRPWITAVLPLAEAARAHTLLEGGATSGKLLLRVG